MVLVLVGSFGDCFGFRGSIKWCLFLWVSVETTTTLPHLAKGC